MPEVVEVVTLRATYSQSHRECLSTSSRASDALLIIEALRRHVCLKNGSELPDVDADFHSRRHGQDVDCTREHVQCCWHCIGGRCILSQDYVLESTLSVCGIFCLARQLLAA